MAEQVNGYRKLLASQYDTYNHWRDFCLTHGINVDFSFGNQCWDVPALLWYQYGLYFQTGNGYAWGAWAYMRDANAKNPFIKIERLSEVKRGDCVVFNASGLNYTGHVAFADGDYETDKYWDANINGYRLKCLGQNQGQGIGYGTPSNVMGLSMKTFMGAFRNTLWKSVDPTPPTPTGFKHKKEFPWVLYSQKFRTKRR